ncbi:hypothetical protein FOTG_08881 [Fusarium oxysporum f. sp. vasinfectum 25433]|uniref:Uncharacterized protein n=1 Tax=Fusarium oxysporum f. sp. vasinfectum 25433 TaxID=1089449 RepID=X0LDD1_FUSOX|nr:hypothetical protein FOTG_08881 [Fusarium oxysporum f. sp. vasinfectum 25433]
MQFSLLSRIVEDYSPPTTTHQPHSLIPLAPEIRLGRRTGRLPERYSQNISLIFPKVLPRQRSILSTEDVAMRKSRSLFSALCLACRPIVGLRKRKRATSKRFYVQKTL